MSYDLKISRLTAFYAEVGCTFNGEFIWLDREHETFHARVIKYGKPYILAGKGQKGVFFTLAEWDGVARTAHKQLELLR